MLINTSIISFDLLVKFVQIITSLISKKNCFLQVGLGNILRK